MSTIPMEKNNRLSNPLIKFSGMPMRVVSRNPVQFTYKMQKTISKAVLEEVEETGNPFRGGKKASNRLSLSKG